MKNVTCVVDEKKSQDLQKGFAKLLKAKHFSWHPKYKPYFSWYPRLNVIFDTTTFSSTEKSNWYAQYMLGLPDDPKATLSPVHRALCTVYEIRLNPNLVFVDVSRINTILEHASSSNANDILEKEWQRQCEAYNIDKRVFPYTHHPKPIQQADLEYTALLYNEYKKKKGLFTPELSTFGSNAVEFCCSIYRDFLSEDPRRQHNILTRLRKEGARYMLLAN